MSSNDLEKFCRLPLDVVPVNYKMCITPDVINFTFDGELDVNIEVKNPTNTFMMNSVDLKLKAVKIYVGEKSMSATDVSFNEKNQTVRLTFSEQLNKGSAVLSLQFSGELNDKMKGFYRTKSVRNGLTKYFACTQFEPTDARRCFPCWDEPAIKATFDCSLVVPSHMVALSNMGVVAQDEDKTSGKTTYTYAKTPIMSTYLLAFVVGEYDYIEGVSNHGVKIRTYTPLGKTKQGEFSLEVAKKALDFFTEYFKIPYPLDKLDLIAIADFSAGAMENWGLVTYRETALLIDSETSAKSNYNRVAMVVCHELAHMWFGNLVTMEWWTHLWLNEGFANFMQYLSTDHCCPSYNIWETYINDVIIRALDLDSLDSSHPIEVPINHPSEVDEIFDLISYCKGSSTIRMLNNWIGEKYFQTGLQKYLKKHSYKNTFTEDLWEALSNESGLPVDKVMSSWTKQMGFPQLNVEIKSFENECIILHLTQKKFSGKADTNDKNTILWNIPLQYITSSKSSWSEVSIMSTESIELKIENVSQEGWVKFNPGLKGFYRINYSNELLERLMGAVENNQLDMIDRLNVVNDLFAMASSGQLSVSEYLNALKHFKNEMSYSVLKEIATGLTMIKHVLWHNDEICEKFSQYSRSLFTNVWEKLGWEASSNEDHMTPMFRGLALSFQSGKHIDEECCKKFLDHLEGKKKIPVDLETAVFAKYVKYKEVEGCQNLFKLYEKAESDQERTRIMMGFKGCPNKEVFDMIMKYILSDNLRDNIRCHAIAYLSSASNQVQNWVWKYAKNNYQVFLDKYKGCFLMSRFVQYTTDALVGEDVLNDVKEFYSNHEAPGAERAVQQALEMIGDRTKWWKRDKDAISKFLYTTQSTESFKN